MFDSSHTTFYQLALEDTWVKYAYVQLKVWRDISLHPIASSVPFVEDVRERESVALTGCLPCGYMVTGGMLAVGLMANALTPPYSCVPLSTTGQSPRSSSGTRLCSFRAAEGCQCIRREGLPKKDTLTHTWTGFPPRIPWRPTLLPSGSRSDRSGEREQYVQLSPVLSFCKCPQQATKTNTYLHSSLTTL